MAGKQFCLDSWLVVGIEMEVPKCGSQYFGENFYLGESHCDKLFVKINVFPVCFFFSYIFHKIPHVICLTLE